MGHPVVIVGKAKRKYQLQKAWMTLCIQMTGGRKKKEESVREKEGLKMVLMQYSLHGRKGLTKISVSNKAEKK